MKIIRPKSLPTLTKTLLIQVQQTRAAVTVVALLFALIVMPLYLELSANAVPSSGKPTPQKTAVVKKSAATSKAVPAKDSSKADPTDSKSTESKTETTGAEEELVYNHVALVEMVMTILPGTKSYLDESIERAESEGAAVLIIRLDTPGGMLTASQEMVQSLFSAKVPVVIYVAPTGAAAISAGVFITMAGNFAVMAPGTSIGAAHPVSGEGKDIEGDMKDKVTNITAAMVRGIAEQRGRNVEWAEKSVKESSSLTEKEAVEEKVIDFVASDLDDLLKKLEGRVTKVDGVERTLGDYSDLPRVSYPISTRDAVINFLSNPVLLAILWLIATTGISMELYNPGAVIPGVLGVTALILVLAMSQVIPMSQGAILLMALGGILIGAEVYVGTGFLGIVGIVALGAGAMYLIDVSAAPGMEEVGMIAWVLAGFVGGLSLLMAYAVARTYRRKVQTGNEGLIGLQGEALETFTSLGRVYINGEIWKAANKEGVIEKKQPVEVVGVLEGLVLQVRGK